jgi:DNA-binding response OmpR family regulator
LEGRVLIIEANTRNRNLLQRRFAEDGLEVTEATTGAEGISEAIRHIPQVILLSTTLPDLTGIDVAEKLRSLNRTKHIYLMMIGARNDRKERLSGLDTGANDFITSPIDADLIALRVRNALNRQNQENNTDPITGMPAGRRVQAVLRELVRDREGDWTLMRFCIQNLDSLREVYGRITGNNMLRETARILAEALSHAALEDDFLGYGGRDDFIVITRQNRSSTLTRQVENDFRNVINAIYTEEHRASGRISLENQEFPLAALRIQSVTPQQGPFYDIRSLTEALSNR